jgi:hypothetical protein
MPIAVVVLAAASCFAINNKLGGQDGTAEAAQAGQMAGSISSSGSPGQNPGSASGAGS